MKIRNKKTKVFTIIMIAIVAIGGWGWYQSRTSNPWNADKLGDIPTPLGYTRVEAPAGSYTDYLRNLPLKGRGAKVQLYTGGDARLQWLSTGVIDQPMLSNSEQCADVTMRLRAEYLWSRGRYGEIVFTNVNGQKMRYQGGGSRKAFERYMRNVYGVCGTFSLHRETRPRLVKDIQPGDVFVYPARPGHKYGHAVLVADVARSSSGKVAVMCVEGNTPARETHIIRNFNPLRNPWFILDEDDDSFLINCFHFGKDELRHY